MKILVTGAGGFLGVNVVERLLVHGHSDIRCFLRDKSKAARIEALAGENPGCNVEICYGNLKSRADCERAVADAGIVIHLAAGLKGAPAELFVDSVVTARNLLEALGARSEPPIAKTRVVLVSSFGVYGVAQLGRGAPMDEATPLENSPERRDPYSHSKLRQEQLVREYQQRLGFELVVLRPGVIYGPGGGAFSNRVGIQVGPIFVHMGGNNLLPLSYVVNCAEAIAVAATHKDAAGQAYNVHDDEMPTAAEYLRAYKKNVRKLRSVRLPYFATKFLAGRLEGYHRRSQGQLPAIITRYKAAAAWGGNTFSNAKLRGLGWRPLVSTQDGMMRTFEYLRGQSAGK